LYLILVIKLRGFRRARIFLAIHIDCGYIYGQLLGNPGFNASELTTDHRKCWRATAERDDSSVSGCKRGGAPITFSRAAEFMTINANHAKFG